MRMNFFWGGGLKINRRLEIIRNYLYIRDEMGKDIERDKMLVTLLA